MCFEEPQSKGDEFMSRSTRVQPLNEARMEEAVSQYLAERKNWKPAEFRVELRGVTPDEICAVVWAVHHEDEVNPVPGAGKSIELHIRLQDYRVIRELKFQ